MPSYLSGGLIPGIGVFCQICIYEETPGIRKEVSDFHHEFDGLVCLFLSVSEKSL